MLRGNCPAKIDEKGRLKIPQAFRSLIEKEWGRDLFVTSLNGDDVRIYPLPTWEKLEKDLGPGPWSTSVKRYIRAVNYWGQQAEIDNQGRVLIHPHLREKAATLGDVSVLGSLDHLVVLNHERLTQDVDQNPVTEADEAEVAAVRRRA
jgi:MraZ protein